MPGPPPKPPGQARRRNAQPAVTLLPAAGRKGRAPVWPLGDPPAMKGVEVVWLAGLEAELWAELWRMPQAVAWEQMSAHREVAQYVRFKVRGECGHIDSAKEARQLGDRLGMTPLALLRLRWQIDTRDEVGEKRTEAPAPARQRFQVVDPGAVAGS